MCSFRLIYYCYKIHIWYTDRLKDGFRISAYVPTRKACTGIMENTKKTETFRTALSTSKRTIRIADVEGWSGVGGT